MVFLKSSKKGFISLTLEVNALLTTYSTLFVMRGEKQIASVVSLLRNDWILVLRRQRN